GITTCTMLLGGGADHYRTDTTEAGDLHCAATREIGIRTMLAVGLNRRPFPKTYRSLDLSRDVTLTFEDQLEVCGQLAEAHGDLLGEGTGICLIMPVYSPDEVAQNSDEIRQMCRAAMELREKHGLLFTQDGHREGSIALAEELGFLVLYPEQARQVQVSRCWNWFRPVDQTRGAGEPALIASLTRHILTEQPVDPARVYIAGLSAGASAALVLATAYPDIFAAVGVHSGLPVGAAHDAATAVIAMRHGAPGQRHAAALPTIIFHGDADTVVHPRNGRFAAIRATEPFAGLRKTERRGQVAGGRSYLRITHRKGSGRPLAEHWIVEGSGHAWSGGNGAGSFTDPKGPDASREMMRFFLRHRAGVRRRAKP
ncbi:hypothetical protein LCGC14_1951650, partial [marine sediment metagenome]